MFALARFTIPTHDACMHAITYRGLQVHLGTRAEVFQKLTSYLRTSEPHQVLTLNPEYVVLAKHNPELVALSQRAALCIVDGMGLALAVRHFGKLERYPGADLVPELCAYCAAHQVRIGIVLLPGGLSTPEQVLTVLQQHYPNLTVGVWYQDNSLQLRIETFQPTVLFVALGQPTQDLWIAKHLQSLPSIRVAIGVGGAVDFLTGVRRRAPRVMRSLGVEWLWRLITQPRRVVRIFRATFGFWYTILFQ
jgi:N-acetylglucosaminyldiphosphoundecaprenol N-acetyl-beta-D-mannosaminyltransferase